MPASYSSNSYTPDGLLVGGRQIISRNITLLSGQTCVRGALLGKISIGAATTAAKSGGNTGNGTITMDGTTPIKAGAKVGVYKVRFTVAATNNGTFVVTDPDNIQVGIVVMAGGTGTYDGVLKFAIADGATDFIVGDGFDITIAAGSGKYILSLAAAVDGSQVPDAILAEATDASAADKATVAYFTGGFDDSKVTYGTGHTAASVREGLRAKELHLISVQTTY